MKFVIRRRRIGAVFRARRGGVDRRQARAFAKKAPASGRRLEAAVQPGLHPVAAQPLQKAITAKDYPTAKAALPAAQAAAIDRPMTSIRSRMMAADPDRAERPTTPPAKRPGSRRW